MSNWAGLQKIDDGLFAAVSDTYKNLLQFDGSFEDEAGARSTVEEFLAGKRTAGDIENISKELWAWRQSRLKRRPSEVVLLQRRLPEFAASVPRSQKDITAVFEEAVNTTPAVALSLLKRAIRAARAHGDKEEVENKLREKWALELVAIIQEAELPAAERIAALGNDNHFW